MKVKIQRTIFLRQHELEAMKMKWQEDADEGESLRDYIKTNCGAYCDYFVEAVYNEMRLEGRLEN